MSERAGIVQEPPFLEKFYICKIGNASVNSWGVAIFFILL